MKLNLDNHRKEIIELVQQWKLGLISEEGFFKLNSWYQALTDRPLGLPDGLAVEDLEYWIHKQCVKPMPIDEDGRRAALDSLRKGK